MSENLKRTLFSGVLGAGLALFGLFVRDWIIRSDHDEPIIIEEGSIKADFDLAADSQSNPGDLIDENRSYYREGADPLVAIRLWKKVNGQTIEIPCISGSTGPCALDDRSLSVFPDTGQRLAFHWGKNPNSSIRMISAKHRLRRSASKDALIEVEEDSQTPLKLDSVRFKAKSTSQWTQVPLRNQSETIEKVAVQLCSSTEGDHCGPYTIK
ncbi:MAG: hypothetical protein SFV51_32060 [Bryobacteraceae bacterium]|nr:hypothetical protein [Bryobacteraceae bacterium]